MEQDVFERAIQDYLSCLPLARATEFVPDDIIVSIKRDGARDFADELEESWTLPMMQDFMQRCRLSRRKYNRVRNSLFKVRQPHSNSYVHKTIMGVNVPVPPAWKTVRKFNQSICDSFRLEQSDDGTSAMLNPVIKACHDVASAVKNDWLKCDEKGKVTGSNDGPVVFVHSFDAAKVLGGTSVSALTTKIVNLEECAGTTHAPVHTASWLLWEGGDDNDALSQALGACFCLFVVCLFVV